MPSNDSVVGECMEASWMMGFETKQEKIPVNYSYRAGLDVLAGRSERIKKNNLFYRLQIHEHFALYNDCENHDKRPVAQLIVRAVQNRGGRFLDNQGRIMTDRQAVKKTMKALKDLRKTHGRNAPEFLPPRLAKMTVSAQKEAAQAAAAKLMELQQHQLPEESEAWQDGNSSGEITLPVPILAAPQRLITPENPFIIPKTNCETFPQQNRQWNATTITVVTGDMRTEVSVSPSELSLSEEEEQEEFEDLYEPLPLDFAQEACPSPLLGPAAEAVAASLTFLQRSRDRAYACTLLHV